MPVTMGTPIFKHIGPFLNSGDQNVFSATGSPHVVKVLTLTVIHAQHKLYNTYIVPAVANTNDFRVVYVHPDIKVHV